MDYREFNDNELVYLCYENNEDAYNILIGKYKNCIMTILKDFKKKYNILGIEMSDLYQEGLLGLFQAIKSYNKKKDVLFYTYANACIRKNMTNAVKKTFEKKHRILNNSYSLDKVMNNSNNEFYEVFKDIKNEPNKVILEREEEKEIIDLLNKKFSKNEMEIFKLKLKGLKNESISNLIDKDKKYVENTVFRINKKYKEILNENVEIK